jgi:zinc/manganese transport system ATP-binding protein
VTDAVALNGVTLRRGRRRLLDAADLSIAQGEFVGLLGANGAGKTSLLRLILGLLPPDAGTVSVLGAQARRGHPGIGYMPQLRDLPGAAGRIRGADLLAGALQGARWGMGWLRPDRAARRIVAEALDHAEASPLALRRLDALSGGERQRLMLAQALMGRPRLLLLDEPLAGLDPRFQAQAVALVRRVQQRLGITVLFSAHEVNPLLGALDRVLYLGQGRAALGRVDSVIRPEVLSTLYGTPMRVVRGDGHIFVTPDTQPVPMNRSA